MPPTASAPAAMWARVRAIQSGATRVSASVERMAVVAACPRDSRRVQACVHEQAAGGADVGLLGGVGLRGDWKVEVWGGIAGSARLRRGSGRCSC